MKNALQSLIPSGTELVAGAATAAMMFVGNHVLHIGFMQGQVETALTPFASLLVASIVHKATPTPTQTRTVLQPITVDAEKLVESFAKRILVHLDPEAEPPAATVTYGTGEKTAAATPAYAGGVVLPASTEAPHITQ